MLCWFCCCYSTCVCELKNKVLCVTEIQFCCVLHNIWYCSKFINIDVMLVRLCNIKLNYLYWKMVDCKRGGKWETGVESIKKKVFFLIWIFWILTKISTNHKNRSTVMTYGLVGDSFYLINYFIQFQTKPLILTFITIKWYKYMILFMETCWTSNRCN